MQSLTLPGFTRRLGELSSASDRVWLTGMTTGLVATFIAAFAPLPATGGHLLRAVNAVDKKLKASRDRESASARTK